MADPEIQMILTDPVVRQVLNDFKDNPQHAQKVTQVTEYSCRSCSAVEKRAVLYLRRKIWSCLLM